MARQPQLSSGGAQGALAVRRLLSSLDLSAPCRPTTIASLDPQDVALIGELALQHGQPGAGIDPPLLRLALRTAGWLARGLQTTPDDPVVSAVWGPGALTLLSAVCGMMRSADPLLQAYVERTHDFKRGSPACHVLRPVSDLCKDIADVATAVAAAHVQQRQLQQQDPLFAKMGADAMRGVASLFCGWTKLLQLDINRYDEEDMTQARNELLRSAVAAAAGAEVMRHFADTLLLLLSNTGSGRSTDTTNLIATLSMAVKSVNQAAHRMVELVYPLEGTCDHAPDAEQRAVAEVLYHPSVMRLQLLYLAVLQYQLRGVMLPGGRSQRLKELRSPAAAGQMLEQVYPAVKQFLDVAAVQVMATCAGMTCAVEERPPLLNYHDDSDRALSCLQRASKLVVVHGLTLCSAVDLDALKLVMEADELLTVIFEPTMYTNWSATDFMLQAAPPAAQVAFLGQFQQLLLLVLERRVQLLQDATKGALPTLGIKMYYFLQFVTGCLGWRTAEATWGDIKRQEVAGLRVAQLQFMEQAGPRVYQLLDQLLRRAGAGQAAVQFVPPYGLPQVKAAYSSEEGKQAVLCAVLAAIKFLGRATAATEKRAELHGAGGLVGDGTDFDVSSDLAYARLQANHLIGWLSVRAQNALNSMVCGFAWFQSTAAAEQGQDELPPELRSREWLLEQPLRPEHGDLARWEQSVAWAASTAALAPAMAAKVQSIVASQQQQALLKQASKLAKASEAPVPVEQLAANLQQVLHINTASSSSSSSSSAEAAAPDAGEGTTGAPQQPELIATIEAAAVTALLLGARCLGAVALLAPRALGSVDELHSSAALGSVAMTILGHGAAKEARTKLEQVMAAGAHLAAAASPALQQALPPAAAAALATALEQDLGRKAGSGSDAKAATGSSSSNSSSSRERQQEVMQLLAQVVIPGAPGCANPTCINVEGPSEASLHVQVCTACKGASYCGKGCQKQHWKAHKAQCKAAVAAAAAADNNTADATAGLGP